MPGPMHRPVRTVMLLGRDFPRSLAPLRRIDRNPFDDEEMLFHGEPLDKPRFPDHFWIRKRRRFVNLFRNKRRRPDRFWKHTEFARHLLERLLLVGPMQG